MSARDMARNPEAHCSECQMPLEYPQTMCAQCEHEFSTATGVDPTREQDLTAPLLPSRSGFYMISELDELDDYSC